MAIINPNPHIIPVPSRPQPPPPTPAEICPARRRRLSNSVTSPRTNQRRAAPNLPEPSLPPPPPPLANGPSEQPIRARPAARSTNHRRLSALSTNARRSAAAKNGPRSIRALRNLLILQGLIPLTETLGPLGCGRGIRAGKRRVFSRTGIFSWGTTLGGGWTRSFGGRGPCGQKAYK